MSEFETNFLTLKRSWMFLPTVFFKEFRTFHFITMRPKEIN